ncbi:helix-turn-helix domain-containing protein [Mycolicibacterium fortuitum]|uniref:Uncharacterized protein n=2 Tax=Mycolicibacterium fortuitum TaxID=1766 RepID=A0AAE5AFG4_MYCFO|nr:hypothetical protein [Mycolicibacterium fortuitum]MCV7137956.1 hypothetical protein [Mycolicibacterium fortuitum]MDV7194523.1 hypothetical protein [Mycolicibacterium fortuitum]MDV7207848.1 hypothetical protein [Mycolicibacterium fortuitum]MDV7229145.1 hypothetical protein [Mycolicibacterium fortuitum]MDV7260845.1 hypothetical protein [Mycolicibacterium fortuitum]
MNDWESLANAVRARRLALKMTQFDVGAAGGPSAAKIREIENMRASVLSPSKRRDLERALQWPLGAVDVALEGGGVPEILEVGVDSGSDQSVGVAAHLRDATEIQGAIKALHERLPTVSAARLHLLDALVAVERAVRELEGQSDQVSRSV